MRRSSWFLSASLWTVAMADFGRQIASHRQPFLATSHMGRPIQEGLRSKTTKTTRRTARSVVLLPRGGQQGWEDDRYNNKDNQYSGENDRYYEDSYYPGDDRGDYYDDRGPSSVSFVTRWHPLALGCQNLWGDGTQSNGGLN